MKWIRTALLVLVALALGLWAYYGERHLDKKEAEHKAANRLFQFTANSVAAITLVTSEDTIHAVRQMADQWAIERPVPWTAESANWESVVRNTLFGERERGWIVSADSFHFYGLDPPRARVVFHLRGETQTSDTLDVGIQTPTGSRCYVRFPRADSVFTTTVSVYSAAVRRLFDLRDKTVMPLTQEMVQEVAIARGRTDLSLRRDDGTWKMTSPTPRSADNDSVTALLRDITTARASAFHDRPTDLRRFGLDPPTAELRLVASTGGQTLEKRLLLGSSVTGAVQGAAPPSRYVMDPSRNSVMEAPGSLFKSAMRPPENYWDRALTRFQRRDINRVSVVSPDSTIEVSMDTSATWRFAEPHEYEGTCKRWRVNTIVADADLARGTVFVDGPGPYGFDHPQLSVILYHDADEKSRIDFGRSRGDMVYTKGSATDQVFLVDRQLMKKFQVSTFELKELPIPGQP